MKEIVLTQGMVALVDDIDFEYLNQWKWYAAKLGKHSNTLYAVRADYKNGKRMVLMHREIMGATDPKIFCDHEDRNGLNNQRSNLRIATNSQNNCNSKKYKKSYSQYKGVSWEGDRNKWKASIRKDYKLFNVGRFKTEEEAALAYNYAAIKYHGEFANLNVVQ